MPYLRNAWYVAAWDKEVPAEGLFARTLLDEPVVLYRTEAGEPRALFDQCPHRFVPLHMGTRLGSGIRCGYHGLEFDETGLCVRNPHGAGRIPQAARVRAYPVVERHSLIWIWMGDPALADDSLIPDFGFLDPDANEVGQGYLHARGNYLLEVDNIMDLSHIEFLHSTSLGSPGISTLDPVVSREGDRIWCKRFIPDHTLSDFMYQLTRISPGSLVDRWIEVRWDAPSIMQLHVGMTKPGRPREEGDSNFQCHIFTPETETTTHYWYGIGFPKTAGPQAREWADIRIHAVRAPFEMEDLPIIEAQQARMGNRDIWEMRPVVLASDAGAVQARRVLSQLIQREAEAATAAPTAAE